MVSYYNIIKEDPEKLMKERQRVKDFLNQKYMNDDEYRRRRVEYSRLYRLKKKQAQNDIKI